MESFKQTAEPQEDAPHRPAESSAPPSRRRDLVVNHLHVMNGSVHEADHNNNNHDWLTLIPSILERRNLQCTEQTSESARALMESGLLGNFTQDNNDEHSSHVSLQVEASLLESFVEDDYDGALHLTTVDVAFDDGKNSGDNNNRGGRRPIGFVFWRQVPQEEMRDWINWEILQKRIMGERERELQSEESREVEGSDKDSSTHQQQKECTKRRQMRHSLRSVRRESVKWLEIATTANSSSPAPTPNSVVQSSSTTNNSSVLVETLTHCWVKLELLEVHPDYWKQHIGTLLLACAMYQAHQNGDDRMILHVAGGKENIPALRLYEKFGFLPVPRETVFHKPDKDLYVLGHVGQSLRRLCWSALEV